MCIASLQDRQPGGLRPGDGFLVNSEAEKAGIFAHQQDESVATFTPGS